MLNLRINDKINVFTEQFCKISRNQPIASAHRGYKAFFLDSCPPH